MDEDAVGILRRIGHQVFPGQASVIRPVNPGLVGREVRAKWCRGARAEAGCRMGQRRHLALLPRLARVGADQGTDTIVHADIECALVMMGALHSSSPPALCAGLIMQAACPIDPRARPPDTFRALPSPAASAPSATRTHRPPDVERSAPDFGAGLPAYGGRLYRPCLFCGYRLEPSLTAGRERPQVAIPRETDHFHLANGCCAR